MTKKCWWFLHRFKYISGQFHRYYECKKCGLRKLVRGVGGHQPINQRWLDGRD